MAAFFWGVALSLVMSQGCKQKTSEISTAKPQDKPLSLIVFGDSGTSSRVQKRVANAMIKLAREKQIHHALMLGDNFYPNGVSSSHDPAFVTAYEQMYKGFAVDQRGAKRTFGVYPILGNHDYRTTPLAQVHYQSETWQWGGPSATARNLIRRSQKTYYSFTLKTAKGGGTIAFFALDTNTINKANAVQLRWLAKELKASKADFNIVYGHHPVISYGRHSILAQITKSYMRSKLLPLLCRYADLYIAGHEHDQQVLKAHCGLPLLIHGASGKDVRSTHTGSKSLFAASQNGFGIIDIDTSRGITATNYNADGEAIFKVTFPNFRKHPSASPVPTSPLRIRDAKTSRCLHFSNLTVKEHYKVVSRNCPMNEAKDQFSFLPSLRRRGFYYIRSVGQPDESRACLHFSADMNYKRIDKILGMFRWPTAKKLIYFDTCKNLHDASLFQIYPTGQGLWQIKSKEKGKCLHFSDEDEHRSLTEGYKEVYADSDCHSLKSKVFFE